MGSVESWACLAIGLTVVFGVVAFVLLIFRGESFSERSARRELQRDIASERKACWELENENRELKQKIIDSKPSTRLVLSCPECNRVWIVHPTDCIFYDGNWCLDCNNESVTWDLTIELGYDMLQSMQRAEKKLRKRNITIGQSGMRPFCCG